MTAQLQSPWIYLADSDGEPLVGAKVRIYEPGTTTPLDIYSDEAAEVGDVVAQPVVSDAAGRITRYFVTQKYKMTVHTSADVLVTTLDDQDPGLPSGFGVSATVQIAQGGTGATNAAAARANLLAASSDAVTDLQDTITEHETFIDTARNVSDPTRAGLMAKEDTASRATMAAGTGAFRLQRVSSTTVSDSTVNTTTPAFDTSIPQVSEGEQIMSLAITPLLSTSTIIFRGYLTFTTGTTPMNVVFHLHRNGAADAVDAEGGAYAAAQGTAQLYYEESPGSTSTITYTVRAGVSTSSITIPGSNNLGALRRCRIIAEEWVAV